MTEMLSPEGLTLQQDILVGLLFDTKTIAPVGKRKTLSNGQYKLYKIERPTSPIDFAQNDEEFAFKHHEDDPGAPLSPVAINLRNLPAFLFDKIGEVMAEIPTDEIPDVVSGIPDAGTPLAETYSKFSKIPVAKIFRKIQVEKGRMIVATHEHLTSPKSLRIIDDLATMGKTKIEAFDAANQMGYRVVDLVVLVDRQQGAADYLKQAGYTLRSAFTIDQLLRYGVRTNRITSLQYDQVADYLHLR